MPDGLNLLNGAISGTPIVSGNFSPAITAQDSLGNQITTNLPLVIRSAVTDIVLLHLNAFVLTAGGRELAASVPKRYGLFQQRPVHQQPVEQHPAAQFFHSGQFERHLADGDRPIRDPRTP